VTHGHDPVQKSRPRPLHKPPTRASFKCVLEIQISLEWALNMLARERGESDSNSFFVFGAYAVTLGRGRSLLAMSSHSNNNQFPRETPKRGIQTRGRRRGPHELDIELGSRFRSALKLPFDLLLLKLSYAISCHLSRICKIGTKIYNDTNIILISFSEPDLRLRYQLTL